MISSLYLASRCFSAHPNLSGLVDPPCHAQETPHLLEGNRCVPAANGMRTVQTQQVQACWHRVSDGIWSASRQTESIRQRANVSLQLSPTDIEEHGVHLPLSFVPLLPSLNVDVCCSGAPRTTEEAPANPAVATPTNCKSERIETTPLVAKGIYLSHRSNHHLPGLPSLESLNSS